MARRPFSHVTLGERTYYLYPIEHAIVTTMLGRRGEIISREDLIAAVWSDPDEEPANPEWTLSTAIKQIRRAYPDLIDAKRWVIPREGQDIPKPVPDLWRQMLPSRSAEARRAENQQAWRRVRGYITAPCPTSRPDE